ncbi:hypothetical protein [Nocardia sp. X0981]
MSSTVTPDRICSPNTETIASVTPDIGRAERLRPPEQLRSFDLAPRHLSLLSPLLLDGAE